MASYSASYADASMWWFQWIVTVHRTPEGEVGGVLVVSEDKTERRLTFRR